MIKIVIVEDEIPASELLKKHITSVDENYVVVKTLYDKNSAIDFLKQNMPDLLFMDINLTDGNSLDIFKVVDVKCPVVFITAYDNYWQEAFELNSIDYILKPISIERIKICLDKYKNLKELFSHDRVNQLMSHVSSRVDQYKKRFLIRKASELLVISVEEIAYFFSSNKITFLVTDKNFKHIIDYSLTDLENMLESENFFRVNRQIIARRSSIIKIKTAEKGKLELDLYPEFSEMVVVSQENVSAFKKWLE